MDFQGAVRARLIANAGVIVLVAQRVYWSERPQNSPLPSISMELVSQQRPQDMAGFVGIDSSIVQVDCWATSSLSAYQIGEAVIAALIPAVTSDGVRFERAFVDSIRSFGERTETQFIHRKLIDLIFHHSVA